MAQSLQVRARVGGGGGEEREEGEVESSHCLVAATEGVAVGGKGGEERGREMRGGR